MKKVVDKTIDPVRALQAGNLTTAQAQQMYNGVLPIGDYKGVASILDLDKLVNQPLVSAEQLYSLDRIDERDAITSHLAIDASPATAPVLATLEVPADELWILFNVDIACLVTAIADEVIRANFRLSIWPFPDVRGGATVNPAGRAFWTPAAAPEATSTVAIEDSTAFAGLRALGAQLRLPGGSVLTLEAASTGAPLTEARDVTLTPYGRKVKVLVA